MSYLHFLKEVNVTFLNLVILGVISRKFQHCTNILNEALVVAE